MKNSPKRAAPLDANKDRAINVRYTSADFARVAENARQSGLTVSEWIRRTSTKTPAKKVRTAPPINRQTYLVLSILLLEFSELSKLIKHGEKFADLRNGVIERTLVKINSQILEVKRRLL